jgi:hypothetical protein
VVEANQRRELPDAALWQIEDQPNVPRTVEILLSIISALPPIMARLTGKVHFEPGGSNDGRVFHPLQLYSAVGAYGPLFFLSLLFASVLR